MPLTSRMQSRAARSLTTSTANAGAGNPSYPAPKFVDNAPPPPVGYGGSRFTAIQTPSGGGIPAASSGRGSFIPPAASQSRFSQPITRPLPRPVRPPSPPLDEGDEDEKSAFLHQIQLDTNQAGIVIGKGGVTIHRIQHESGAKMRTLPAGSGGARQLEISSDNPQCVDKAVQMVMEQLESFGRPLGSSGGHHQSNPAAPSLPIPPPPNSTGPTPGFDTREKEQRHYQPAAESEMSEARIVEYVSMPSNSAFEFSPSDLAKLKKELGVRIHQLNDRRLTINGPEGKVLKAKRHLESFLTEEAARQQLEPEPRVVVNGDTIIERVSNATALVEQLDSEVAHQQPHVELVQAANAIPQTPHDSGNSSDEEVATTESGVGASGGDENGEVEEDPANSFWTPTPVPIAQDGFEELDEWVQVASDADADASPASLIPSSLKQLMQSVGEMTEELGGLRADVAEMRKTHRRDSETASATIDQLKQAMETVTNLRADIKKLQEAKVEEQLPKSPICVVCNARMCKVLAGVGNTIICSTRCSECSE